MGSDQVCSLGIVTVEPGGPTVKTFDAAAFAPGGLRVSATVNGAAQPGLTVQLVKSPPVVGGGFQMTNAGSSRLITDDQGTCHFERLFPGEWTLSITPAGGSSAWTYREPIKVQLAPGKTDSTTVNVVTATGRVLVKDKATGQPLGTFTLQVGSMNATTDQGGWLTLTLPPGKLTVMAPISEPGKMPWFGEIEWGPGGPLTEEILVER